MNNRPFAVLVDGARLREWGRYRTEAEALAACRALAQWGLAARIIKPVEATP